VICHRLPVEVFVVLSETTVSSPGQNPWTPGLARCVIGSTFSSGASAAGVVPHASSDTSSDRLGRRKDKYVFCYPCDPAQLKHGFLWVANQDSAARHCDPVRPAFNADFPAFS